MQALYPAPRRYGEASGEAFGYRDEVLFPLMVTPVDPAKPVSLALAAGLVVICLSPTPPNFAIAQQAIDAAYGAYGWPSAKVAHRETYRMEANWKLAVENYLECYHCTPSHPEYSKLHALEKPLDKITAMTDAMEARTSALGVSVPSIDHRVGSGSGDASIFIFRYPLYEGVKTGAAEAAPSPR